jgi:hypothetical protein
MQIHSIAAPNAGTPSRLIDRFRDGAAVLYLEGQHNKTEHAATVVLVDADVYRNRGLGNARAYLHFLDGRWVPMIPQRVPASPYPPPGMTSWPLWTAIWRVALNLTPWDPRAVEYRNGDPFDLRVANLRLVDAKDAPQVV